MVDKGLVTNQLVLTVGYDIENLSDPERKKNYRGTVTTDHYGRGIPKDAHGTANLEKYTSSTKQILEAVSQLFERIVDKNLLVRRVNITANHVINEASASKADAFEQLDLLTDYEAKAEEEAELEREKKRQQAVLSIRKKYGKNAILMGMSLEDGAMTIERNNQIGGHKAWMGHNDDIINLPHHVSVTRPQMSRENRAAQFSPFAALTGFDAAIMESARITEERRELDENAMQDLSFKLSMIADMIDNNPGRMVEQQKRSSFATRPPVAITYFQPDGKKEGGAYVKAFGKVKKIDEYERIIVMTNGIKVKIDDVFDIESVLFRDLM